MTDFNFLDSSLWLSYLFDEPVAKSFIDCQSVFVTSVVSLFEIYTRLKKLHYSAGAILNALTKIKQKSVLLGVTEEIVVHAFPWAEKLSLADALLYSTATFNNFQFVTRDNDFRGLPNAQVV